MPNTERVKSSWERRRASLQDTAPESLAGFTLVELVIVILILGILAGVAAPKLTDTSRLAAENGLRQTLAVVRDAIELYAAQNGGELPAQDKAETTFKTQLSGYLRSQFPENPFGRVLNEEASVQILDLGTPFEGAYRSVHGWLYDCKSGEFIANTDQLSSDGVTPYSDF